MPQESQESQSRGVMVCPRCGAPISYIERQRRGDQVYYYAVHYEGYEKTPDGKIRKKVKKCYLGPHAYIEVTKLHSDIGMTLKGLIEEGREKDYINDLANAIETRLRAGRLRPEEALELARSLDRLTELARRLREFASSTKSSVESFNETVPRPQPLETPPKTSQPQTTEAGQDKAEAYRAVSTLTGLPPEDIERQLAKLKEALKELKASH